MADTAIPKLRKKLLVNVNVFGWQVGQIVDVDVEFDYLDGLVRHDWVTVIEPEPAPAPAKDSKAAKPKED